MARRVTRQVMIASSRSCSSSALNSRGLPLVAARVLFLVSALCWARGAQCSHQHAHSWPTRLPVGCGLGLVRSSRVASREAPEQSHRHLSETLAAPLAGAHNAHSLNSIWPNLMPNRFHSSRAYRRRVNYHNSLRVALCAAAASSASSSAGSEPTRDSCGARRAEVGGPTATRGRQTQFIILTQRRATITTIEPRTPQNNSRARQMINCRASGASLCRRAAAQGWTPSLASLARDCCLQFAL